MDNGLLWADNKKGKDTTEALMKQLDAQNEDVTKQCRGRRDSHYATRELVIDAFRELRSKGFMARANFLCCQSCAGYALAEQAKKRIEKGKEIKGVYFWHRQDEESYERSSHLYIAFGNVNVDGKDYGIGDELVGLALVTALVKRGVHVQWDGNTNRRILVMA